MSALAIGGTRPQGMRSFSDTTTLRTGCERGVDPAVRLGRGGAVRVHRTEDRAYASRPDDFVVEDPREC